MISDDIGDTLRDYYAWSRINDPADIGYPHVDTVRRLLGGGISCPGLSDDEARFVDWALCRLQSDEPEAHRLIERVYREGKTLRWLSKHGHGDRRTLSAQLSEGRQYLRGIISGVQYAC